MFGKAVLPFKKSLTPPQSPPNSDFRFIFCFALFQKVNKTNTIHYNSKRKQNQKLHKLSKVKGEQWPKELRLSSWSLPRATYWHRHLSNSHVTPPSLCKSSIHRQSIKEITISEFPQPQYQNKVKCLAFYVEMIFHSRAIQTHFHKKGCVAGLILKVRIFGTPKQPIVTWRFQHCLWGWGRWIVSHAWCLFGICWKELKLYSCPKTFVLDCRNVR